MDVEDLALGGLRLVRLDLHGDERGFFVERFNLEGFREHRLPTSFTQLNHSRSAPGVVRGLHYQFSPPQGKLVGVTRGRIWDVAVDLRPDSPTFGRHQAVELSDLNACLLWVPAGFGHGFCVLDDGPADLVYLVDAPYNPDGEGGIAWDDPELAVPWPTPAPTLSARDRSLQRFADYRRDPPPW